MRGPYGDPSQFADVSKQIDLHGLTVAEATRTFARFYNRSLASGSRARIEVIHGYGSSGAGGVIKERLRKFLAKHAECFEDVVESLSNPGVTYVYPKRAIPGVGADDESPLAAAIRDFCASPRSKQKIVARFVRHGDPLVRATLDAMVRDGDLEVVKRGADTLYRSV